jgi:F-type H+-transporting ATPase subunit delta
MRGASRASLAEARERLSDAVADASAASRLGDEMFAVTALLDGEPALCRMLSNPAQPAEAKAGVVNALLSGRLSAGPIDLVTSLVSAHWSSPADLADAAEQLAVLAILAAAEHRGQLDDLEDELFRFGRVVSAEPELRAVLSNLFVAPERKRALLDGLLADRVTEPTLRLVTQAAAYPRGRSLDASLEDYARLAAAQRARLVAEVHVPAELTAAQRSRLEAALAAAYGHQVHLNVVLDPQVVGGMSIQIGDELIDGSMASRLAALRRRLAA